MYLIYITKGYKLSYKSIYETLQIQNINKNLENIINFNAKVENI